MELLSLIQDNIDEILVRIIQFTNIRHNVLTENIRNCRTSGFVPQRVDEEDFAKVISIALTEHQKSKRLALCDSRTIRFQPGGDFMLESEVDAEAAMLFSSDFAAYIEMQRDRLKENILNNKAACALLHHKLSKAEEINNQTMDSQIGNQI